MSLGAAAGQGVFTIIDRVPTTDSASSVGSKPAECRGQVFTATLPAGKATAVRLLGVVGRRRAALTLSHCDMKICGPSGSGKSTIIGLLERFYDPMDGTVTLDGVDYQFLNIGWTRQQLGYVQQEPVLFSATVRANIEHGVFGKYGDDTPEQRHVRVVEAAKNSNAHDFIVQPPQGHDTQVGERGRLLSGGQRQRAISREVVTWAIAKKDLDPDPVWKKLHRLKRRDIVNEALCYFNSAWDRHAGPEIWKASWTLRELLKITMNDIKDTVRRQENARAWCIKAYKENPGPREIHIRLWPPPRASQLTTAVRHLYTDEPSSRQQEHDSEDLEQGEKNDATHRGDDDNNHNDNNLRHNGDNDEELPDREEDDRGQNRGETSELSSEEDEDDHYGDGVDENEDSDGAGDNDGDRGENNDGNDDNDDDDLNIGK
ncbi:hypothetical protein QFC21_007310 [Naganishia friedmannii]|uniref:Uncharacterized protein n=1 Tax=Naganishia friedmannii TaxID=89922 RepID=A0ACC2UVR2_9TREE|nr:hypothetical protein QFC21_007310 [Naganishia friedmannii]